MDKTYKFTTPSTGWEYVMRGVRATYNDAIRKENDTHEASIIVDPTKKIMSIKTDTAMKANRKITISDVVSKETKVFETNVISAYLAEVPKYLDKTGYMQVEIIGENQPVIVHDYASEKVSDKIPQRVNDTIGVTEEFSIFFSVISKQ
jgi:hypothetical protein